MSVNGRQIGLLVSNLPTHSKRGDFMLLVGCEESQAVANAFRDLGVEAYSCDLQECSGGHPEYHLKMDIFDAIDLLKPSALIAHPPCTFLAKSGSCNNVRDPSRIEKGYSAARFFLSLWNLDIPYICLENPIPQARFSLPPASQWINPYDFYDPSGLYYSKKTGLWLKGFPPLIPSFCGYAYASWCAVHRSAKMRSKTFPGVAFAMANQWYNFVR